MPAKQKKAARAVAGQSKSKRKAEPKTRAKGTGGWKRKATSSASSAVGKKKKNPAKKSKRATATAASSERTRSALIPGIQHLVFTTASIKRVVYAATTSHQGGDGRIGRLPKESLAVLSSCAEQFVTALAKKVAEAARSARAQKVRVLDVEKATHMDPRFDFLQSLFVSSAGVGASLSSSASSTSSFSREAPKATDSVSLNDSAVGIVLSNTDKWANDLSAVEDVGGGVESTLHNAVRLAADHSSLEQVHHSKVLAYEEAQYDDY